MQRADTDVHEGTEDLNSSTDVASPEQLVHRTPDGRANSTSEKHWAMRLLERNKGRRARPLGVSPLARYCFDLAPPAARLAMPGKSDVRIEWLLGQWPNAFRDALLARPHAASGRIHWASPIGGQLIWSRSTSDQPAKLKTNPSHG